MPSKSMSVVFIALKIGHPVEVVGSHRHLPVSNVGGVGSVPPHLSQRWHQNGASLAF